jgi:hypothetical protein
MHTVVQTAPDAITSWVSSVFATNPDSGFGITDTKQKANDFVLYFIHAQ